MAVLLSMRSACNAWKTASEQPWLLCRLLHQKKQPVILLQWANLALDGPLPLAPRQLWRLLAQLPQQQQQQQQQQHQSKLLLRLLEKLPLQRVPPLRRRGAKHHHRL
jgi:hypothetical protein